MPKPKVFISYAHGDEPEDRGRDGIQWLTYVKDHLAPLIDAADVEFWSDTDLLGSQDWETRIFAAIDACNIFILLVSPQSLGSDFIKSKEIPRILERQAINGSAETPALYPILLIPCAGLRSYPWLRTPNMRPKGGKALSEYEMTAGKDERNRVMAGIANDIARVAQAVSSTEGRQAQKSGADSLSVDNGGNSEEIVPESSNRRKILQGFAAGSVLSVSGLAYNFYSTRRQVDSDEWKLIKTVPYPANEARYIAGEEKILTVSGDETVRMWNARTFDMQIKLAIPKSVINSTIGLRTASVSPDMKWVVGVYHNRIVLWNLPEQRFIKTIDDFEFEFPRDASFSLDGSRIALSMQTGVDFLDLNLNRVPDSYISFSSVFLSINGLNRTRPHPTERFFWLSCGPGGSWLWHEGSHDVREENIFWDTKAGFTPLSSPDRVE